MKAVPWPATCPKHWKSKMKKHLNTLFVTTQGSYLAKDGECVLVRVEQTDKARIPIHTLGGIVCFGNVSAKAHFCSATAARTTWL